MDSRYKYRQYKSKAHRFSIAERVGHQIAYTVRTDILIPEGRTGKTTYLPRCTCGWKEPSGMFVSMRVMLLRFDGHVAEVDRQSTLWPNY